MPIFRRMREPLKNNICSNCMNITYWKKEHDSVSQKYSNRKEDNARFRNETHTRRDAVRDPRADSSSPRIEGDVACARTRGSLASHGNDVTYTHAARRNAYVSNEGTPQRGHPRCHLRLMQYRTATRPD